MVAISIEVNGKRLDVAETSTVADLLEHLEIGRQRVAVAVDRQVVPRSTFQSRRLESGDRVEILEAVGGG